MSVKARLVDDTSVTTLQDAGENLASSAAVNTDRTIVTMANAAEKFAQGFTAWQGNAPVYGNAKEGLAKAMKTSEEIVSFGQGNLEAAMKSAQIFATGLQDLSKHVAVTTQASIEDSVATMKAIAGVKSVKDVIDLQTSFARTMMEKMVAESGKLTDASLKLTEQAIAPLTARVSLAVEKFSNAA
jgi:phasin family protein